MKMLVLLITTATSISMVLGVIMEDTNVTEGQLCNSSPFADIVACFTKHKSEKIKSWKYRSDKAAVFAFQGNRSFMQDRFAIEENISNTGVSLFAIFDGHDGHYSAQFVAQTLTTSLKDKITNLKTNVTTPYSKTYLEPVGGQINYERLLQDEIASVENLLLNELKQIKKEMVTKALKDEQQKKLNALNGGNADYGNLVNQGILTTKEKSRLESRQGYETVSAVLESLTTEKIQKLYLPNYAEDGDFNYKKLLDDGILSDQEKSNIESIRGDTSGTTALLVLIDGTKIFAANVGDSLAVIGNKFADTALLSESHKPNKPTESQRIRDTNGDLKYNAVWLIDGITISRSLGDLNVKPLKRIIPDPYTVSYDLTDFRDYKFIIMASDGPWNKLTFKDAAKLVESNRKNNKQLYGAKDIALKAFDEGWQSNITVVVIKI